jgi:hypothetical protein
MRYNVQSDEHLVLKARCLVAARGKLRWGVFLYAVVFLGMCGYFTVVGLRKLATSDQLGLGFVYGVAMGVLWMTFGIIGGLCLSKFLSGLQGDFRLQELLVSYHDRLRDLGQLPETKPGEQDTPPNERP